MTYEYDREADGLYIWFIEDIEKERINYKGELWPVELNNEVGMLFDNEGKLMGIEVLPASKYFDKKRLHQMELLTHKAD